jgi:hypothetical protein
MLSGFKNGSLIFLFTVDVLNEGLDVPDLPPGCSIQLDRQSREYVLRNIRENLRNLKVQVPDRLQTFTSQTGQDLTFGNFIRYHGYEPEVLLRRVTGSVSRGEIEEAVALAGQSAMILYYRIWGDKNGKLGISSQEEAFRRLSNNPSIHPFQSGRNSELAT